MKATSAILLAFPILLGSANLAPSQLKVEPEKLNVVGSRLVGEWKPMPDLSKRLFGNEHGGPLGQVKTISFSSDPTVLQKIPEKFLAKLKSERIYLAGLMKLGNKEYPYCLITHRGNPHVMYFRPKGAELLGDAESFNVFVAVAKDMSNDVLLIGSESIPRPFAAYERINQEK